MTTATLEAKRLQGETDAAVLARPSRRPVPKYIGRARADTWQRLLTDLDADYLTIALDSGRPFPCGFHVLADRSPICRSTTRVAGCAVDGVSAIRVGGFSGAEQWADLLSTERVVVHVPQPMDTGTTNMPFRSDPGEHYASPNRALGIAAFTRSQDDDDDDDKPEPLLDDDFDDDDDEDLVF